MNINSIFEASIVGTITLIIGLIVFNLTINKKNEKNEKPFGLELSFFATGFFLHIIIELIGWNQYICNKKCLIK